MTVLAIDKAKPKTKLPLKPHPMIKPRHKPRKVENAICAIAAGIAIALTDKRSFNEKWSPTPNISKMTPISASWLIITESILKPPVLGPTITPANKYPTSGEIRKRLAIIPKRNAKHKPATIVVISGVSWSIEYLRLFIKNECVETIVTFL